MANIDAARGLQPVSSPNGTTKARLYYCDGAVATAIFIGDPVSRSSDGYVNLVSGGSGVIILGAVVGCYNATLEPIQYLPASTAGYLLIADDPRQEFIIQEDGASDDLTLGDAGLNVNLTTGGTGGSTVNGRSGWEIDSDTETTSTNAQLRIIAIHDVENNTTGDYCRWIVMINYHQANAGAVGAAI